MKQERETGPELVAYDGSYRARPKDIICPESEACLVETLQSVAGGRSVTFRGGGCSLDEQSLNDDIVIQLGDGFAKIDDPKDNGDGGFCIKVGAAARWEDVLERTAPRGLVPPSLVTACDATVGGTLSADCLSRMSCTTGKEGNQIRSFRIVLADGTALDCRRDDPCLERSELFNAVIGGFGYLGAVTEVTFDLMACRTHPNHPGDNPVVLTRSTRHGSNVDWNTLLSTLQANARTNHERYGELKGTREQVLSDAPVWPALSIAAFVNGSGLSANLLEQGFGEARRLKRSPGGVYHKESTFPSKAVLKSAWSTLFEFALETGFPQGEFVDELFGWSFFLGNSLKRAKYLAQQDEDTLNLTQQSFALPCGEGGAFDTRPTRRFIELLMGRLHRAKLRPLDLDVLYIPSDNFLLSASRGLTSFVLTIAFARMNQPQRASDIVDFLYEASRDCRALGGRVHLVKNVIADPSDLRAMHGDAAKAMRELKAKYDKRRILRNRFFERVFEV